MRSGFCLFFLSKTRSQWFVYKCTDAVCLDNLFVQLRYVWKKLRQISKSSGRVHWHVLLDLIFRYFPFRVWISARIKMPSFRSTINMEWSHPHVASSTIKRISKSFLWWFCGQNLFTVKILANLRLTVNFLPPFLKEQFLRLAIF